METTATPASATATPSAPWRRYLTRAGLAVFCLYVAMLFVLALDQHFQWGLFPTKAEREITALVRQLGDSSLPPEKRQAIMSQIVDWNAFAVPVLLKTVDHRSGVQQGPNLLCDSAMQCLQEIALKYYNKDIAGFGNDSVSVNRWWAEMQAQWAKAQAEKKN